MTRSRTVTPTEPAIAARSRPATRRPRAGSGCRVGSTRLRWPAATLRRPRRRAPGRPCSERAGSGVPMAARLHRRFGRRCCVVIRALVAPAAKAGQRHPALLIAGVIARGRIAPSAEVLGAPRIAGRRLRRCRLGTAERPRRADTDRSAAPGILGGRFIWAHRRAFVTSQSRGARSEFLGPVPRIHRVFPHPSLGFLLWFKTGLRSKGRYSK
jgi:hypothetical protein